MKILQRNNPSESTTYSFAVFFRGLFALRVAVATDFWWVTSHGAHGPVRRYLLASMSVGKTPLESGSVGIDVSIHLLWFKLAFYRIKKG